MAGVRGTFSLWAFEPSKIMPHRSIFSRELYKKSKRRIDVRLVVLVWQFGRCAKSGVVVV